MFFVYLYLFWAIFLLFCSRFETFPLKNSTNNNSFDAHKTAAWMLLRFLLLHFSNGLFCKCLGDHSKFNLYKQDNKTVYWWLFSWCFFLSFDFLCDFIVSWWFFSLLTFWCLGNLCLPRNVSKLHQTIKNNCLRSNLINYAHHNFIHIVRFSVLYRNFCSRFTLQSNLIILSWQNVCASNESMKHAK